MVAGIPTQKGAEKSTQQAVRHKVDAASGTPGVTRERLSRVDVAWLCINTLTNLMMILGVRIIKPGVSYRAVSLRIEEPRLQCPRVGQRVERNATGATWVTDSDFKMERNVVRETLPATSKGHEQQALQDLLGELAVQPLEMQHPLWRFYLVAHYHGGSARIARLHH